MKNPNKTPVSTISLFGYLITVLSWEFELGLIALQIFSPKKPGIIPLALLLCVSIAFSIFAIVRGPNDFANLSWTKGRILLTGTQTILVTIFMILFGGTLGFIAIVIERQ